MTIKLIGLGFKEYFKDKFNSFDFSIVLISCIDVSLTFSEVSIFKGNNAI